MPEHQPRRSLIGATLRALGESLRVVADFGDREYRLT
jgi:hypothetical protein